MDWLLLPSVDAVVVAAADVLGASGADGRPADAGADAVDEALDRIVTPTAMTPWAAGDEVEQAVRSRLTGWSSGAAALGTIAAPPVPEELHALLWSTASLVSGAAARIRRTDASGGGLTWALERAGAGFPGTAAAWDVRRVRERAWRPLRHRLSATYGGGTGQLLRAEDAASRERWGAGVAHFDLPIPLELARRVQALVDRSQRHDLDPDGPDLAEQEAFHREHVTVLAHLGAALGPAYDIEDRVAPPFRPPVPDALAATVDAIVVAAADVVAGSTAALPGATEQDVAAVDAALATVLEPAPGLPWSGEPVVARLVGARLSAWFAAAPLAVGPPADDLADPRDQLWWTAGLLAVAGRHSEGLGSVLDGLAGDLQPPLDAWNDELVAVRTDRPVRYQLRTGLSTEHLHWWHDGILLWADDDAARARWEYAVHAWELPIPGDLAGRIQVLMDRFGEHRVPDIESGVYEFTADVLAAFSGDYRQLAAELRRALGPAYRVLEGAPSFGGRLPQPPPLPSPPTSGGRAPAP